MSEENKPASKAKTTAKATTKTTDKTTAKSTKAAKEEGSQGEGTTAAPKKTAKASTAKSAATAKAPKAAAPKKTTAKAAAAESETPTVAKKATKKVKPAKEKGPKIETNIQLSDRSAVIATGGKQYVVRAGDRISIERLTAKPGETTSFDALLVSNGAGEVKVGKPLVAGASVSARVMKHFRDDKKIIYKKRRRKGYDKKTGHRQELTEILIEAVQG